MSFFRNYLRYRLRIFLLLFGILAIFAGTIWLCDLDIRVFLYPATLGVFACVLFFLVDYLSALHRHRHLQDLIREDLGEEIPLPPVMSLEDAEYGELLTALQKMRQKEQAQQAQSLAQTVEYYTLWAHQVKTPVASLRLTLQQEDSPLTRQALLDLARIEQYVQMVLVYLRLDSRGADYVIRHCELDPLLRAAVRKFAPSFIAKKLRVDLQETSAKVVSDEKWLAFVVEQLISNAVKYTKTGGISISFSDQVLCIRDSGIGIAPEDLPRVFENTFTGYNGRGDKTASGIGLYLCRRICQNLGHGLRIESTVGQGTAVYLDLSRRDIATE